MLRLTQRRYMKFALEILQKRTELKESQTEFGKRFNVSHVAVSDWETGKSEAPYKVIEFCHDCNSDWRRGYAAGQQSEDMYARVGRAIAEMVHEITSPEDF